MNLKATDIVFVTSKEGNLNEKVAPSQKSGGGTSTLLTAHLNKKKKKNDGKRGSDPRV